MELFTAFDRAVASTADVVKATAADQMSARTPCTEWDVRALLNHMIGTLWLAEALLANQAPRYPMAPGGLPPGDLAGDDPAATYAEAAAAALAAAAAAAAASPRTFSDSPGRPSPRKPARRASAALTVAPGAPVTHQLIAFLGRNP